MKITRRPVKGYIPRPPDWAKHASEYGSDERTWFSYGLVVNDQDGNCVIFSKEDGQVYVNLQLEPSKRLVLARVGGQIAGAGEGEYVPFVPGDEVGVALPMGREDAGPVILCRLNNSLDKFPMESVAGQDPTKNAFGFRRRRTPFVEEFAGPITFRNALTTALLSLDAKGGVTIKDSEGSVLQIDADAATLQGPSSSSSSPQLILQLNFTEERALLQVGDSQLLINSSKSGDPSRLTLASDLFVTLGPNQPNEHVATTEMVVAMLGAALQLLLTGAGGPGITPLTGTGIAGAITAFNATLAAGGFPLAPPFSAALLSGLSVAVNVPKPPAVGGLQMAPGLGAVRFHTG